jgi:tyrosyl-tRNA synthetase
MFGKLMSIPDRLIANYLTLLTDVSMEEIERLERDMKSGAVNPRNAKVRLAKEIIAFYHDAAAAEGAEEEFNRMFREKGLPDDIPEFEVIEQGAVSIGDEKVEDVNLCLTRGSDVLIKVGKRRFGKVKVT